jgi:serine/threonine protein kinase
LILKVVPDLAEFQMEHVCLGLSKVKVALVADQECKKKAAGKEYTIILAVVSTVIFITTGGVVTFLLTYRCSKRQRRSRRRKLASLSSASGLVTPAFRLYTISELENATDHFSEANLLGQNQPDGGTYKGILLDGTEIAVKILVLSGIQSQKEFVRDMARIARIRHPNVVVLKGCCYDGGRGFAVYEFVSNGSLDKWLHNLTSEAHPLSWVERVRIATTVARGIA